MGLGSRGMGGPVQPNDLGIKRAVKAASLAPIHPNDVGLKKMAGPNPRGMTRTELHSQRAMRGRMPRA